MNSYDGYIYAIAVLLPISATMLIVQTNPYKALVIRGILGTVSALIYTILGAADVALTEALVGAFLATMLYAVAVRSSLVLRLGVTEEIAIAHDLKKESDKLQLPFETSDQQYQEPEKPVPIPELEKLIDNLKKAFSKHYMRVELVPYESEIELSQALIDKTVHATLHDPKQEDTEAKFYQIQIRLPRLYEIMQADPILANVQLVYKKS